jgi:hypothetical protein
LEIIGNQQNNQEESAIKKILMAMIGSFKRSEGLPRIPLREPAFGCQKARDVFIFSLNSPKPMQFATGAMLNLLIFGNKQSGQRTN